MPKTAKLQNHKERFHLIQTRTATTSKKLWQNTKAFIKRSPMLSFLIFLGVLLLILSLQKFLQPQPQEKTEEQITKAVRVYSIGGSPKATFQAKIEKSGVVKIVAQSAGVVQSINVQEGDSVGQGQQIVSLSTNYQGGNAAAIQRKIAQSQFQNSLDTFGTQKDMIQQQRNVATASAEDSSKQREISRKSNDDTNAQINTANDQISQLRSNLDQLQATNPTGEQIPQLASQLAQAESGVLQLRNSQRTLEYQGSNDNPPAKLAEFQKEATLKQLDVQDKGIELDKTVKSLQSSLASVNEALMYPASPFAGTVDRIYVHEGQVVSPGTVIASVTSTEVTTTAILQVPQNIAVIIQEDQPSLLEINGKTIAVKPLHISKEATDGELSSIIYEIPDTDQSNFTNNDYVAIQVPIGEKKADTEDPLIPIDAIYQSQDTASVLVFHNKKAEMRKVTLGNVFGDYVEVFKGLNDGDQVILNRNVIAGDTITIQ